VGRDGHHEFAAGLEFGRDRGKRGMVVVDVLDDVERPNQVVARVLDFVDLRERRTHDLSAQPLLRKRPHFVVEFEPVDVAESGERREVLSRSAANLENARAGRRLHLAPD
jgi:hypothetical protein